MYKFTQKPHTKHWFSETYKKIIQSNDAATLILNRSSTQKHRCKRDSNNLPPLSVNN